MDGSYAVELADVVKQFGVVKAVNHVSLRVRDGEFFSLLGPSGCGKTTSLRLIAGFETPTSGEILIGGKPQTALPPYRRPVNTVFQHYALFPHLTVAQNVSFGLEMKGLDKVEMGRRVNEALEMVHLAGLGVRRPRQLSGGQQQRVALARALVNRPKVLLLDEPLGALDLKLRKAMQEELKQLQMQVGITFVYVTHDQEEALTMSDRIGIMKDGLLLQVGTPIEIYEQPCNRFVADFIGETNFLPVEVSSLGSPVTVSLGGGQQVPATQAEAGIRVGERAVLSVRPEKVHMYSVDQSAMPATAGTASVRGRIQQAIYLGTDTRYIVNIDAGLNVIARIQNMNGKDHRVQAGDLVELRWDADYARVLKE